MSKSRKKKMTREEEIEKILQDAKIFNAKLRPQINLVVRLENLADKIDEELNKVPLCGIEINASGTEKTVVNPLLPAYIKLLQNIQSAYESLGLNYNINPQKINDAKDSDEAGGIDELIKSLKDGD